MDKLFHERLNAIHRSWKQGLVLRSAFRAVSFAILALAAAALLDLANPWPDAGRSIVFWIWIALAALVFLFGLGAVLRHHRSTTARRVDEALGSKRGIVRSAVDLAADSGASNSEFGQMLRERAIAKASDALRSVPAIGRWPVDELRRYGAVALGLFLVLLLLVFLLPGPWGTSLRRILQPGEDVPPFSKYQFQIKETTPSVHYGEDILLAVDVGGAPVDDAVWAQVRDPATGTVSRARCFRGSSGTEFTHRLEKVVSPVDVSFALGRARSKWIPVEVLYQPKISSADVEITPPAYTGLPVERFPLGSKELRALEGSRIALRLTSNRHLSKGSATITPLNDRLQERFGEVVETRALSTRDIIFDWTLRATANVKVDIADVRGTFSAAPLEFTQTALPDNPPGTEIVQPPPMSVATPRSVLPLEIRGEDDFGLGRVSMVRSLVGFRDRAEPLAEGLLPRTFSRKESIELQTLGARPGDVLEFYAEASDRNPSLLGISTSEVARVQIISEEDYAAILRARISIEEFTARYQVAMDALQQAREALAAMEQAAASGDAEATAKATEAAAAALENARKTMEQIAKDFPAFEMEKELAVAAAEATKPVQEARQLLQALGPQPDPAKAAEAARQAMEKLGAAQAPMDEKKQDAELVAQAGKVLELAAELREIHANQKSLSDRMLNLAKELASGHDANAAQLEGLARLQKDNAERLRQTARTLKERAAALPPELSTFKSDVEEFSQALEDAQIDSLMDEAAKNAEGGRSTDAASNALMAFQSLDLLFQGGNCMSSACRGSDELRFDLRQSLADTLKQMMRSLSAKPGQGNQPGGGASGAMGAGGTGSGSSMPGPNVPAFGPPRSSFAAPGGGTGGTARGSGGRGGRGDQGPEVGGGTAALDGTRDQGTPPPPPDKIPEKYREAVKRFFGGETKP
jgi:hypothetical protein